MAFQLFSKSSWGLEAERRAGVPQHARARLRARSCTLGIRGARLARVWGARWGRG
ncbi:hypothetical protein TIFTF001_050447, partial [Ficus carica]